MMKLRINRRRAGRVIEEIRNIELLDDENNSIGHVSFTRYGRGSGGFYEVSVSQENGAPLSIHLTVDPQTTGPEVMTSGGTMWRFRPKDPGQRLRDKRQLVENLTRAPVRVKAYYLEATEIDNDGPRGRLGSMRVGGPVPEDEEEI